MRTPIERRPYVPKNEAILTVCVARSHIHEYRDPVQLLLRASHTWRIKFRLGSFPIYPVHTLLLRTSLSLYSTYIRELFPADQVRKTLNSNNATLFYVVGTVYSCFVLVIFCTVVRCFVSPEKSEKLSYGQYVW